ncbi:NAD(P)-dependent oxidoreductase [uncultured Bacteroides sp.]|uniref:NAD-dependent epimerase/dehydratase family protein n=1 Tax=uncultured Bacteroides sp. TaxID=162156 RepID=UPI00261DA64A|nr:NAD-dependent epimerase/dehydratase family protein [uncultured Bacteroides sp.]
MKLLFTGASGFLGNNVRPLLEAMYDVTTIGLLPQDDYTVNIAKEIPDLHEQYDIVLHAAGKAHTVPKTEAEGQVFFDVNLQGTKNLCAALEKKGVPQAFVFISTVAVYGCDYGENITEEHPLDGVTPYAMSKRLAEEYLQKWCHEHNVVLGIIRPSLIAGPNPPGNLGAMIHGIRSGRYLSIAGSQARKSVLMVQDIAQLVPLLAEKGGIYNVCDSYQPTFRELETIICRQLNRNLPLSIPYWMAKCMALVGDCLGKKAPINSLKLKKITKSLTFSNEKVMRELGWEPTNVSENFKIE